MRRFLTGIFTALGLITFLLLLLLGLSFYRLTGTPSFPSSTSQDAVVLSLTLGDEDLPQQSQRKGIKTLINGQPLSLFTIIDGIKSAAKDKRIKGILLTLKGESLRIASAQEVRDALKNFKASGKFVYVYTDTFGELSNGTMAYYLAAAASRIWVLPLGSLNYIGMMAEMPFARGALDKLQVLPQVGRREEYKGAAETFTESDFTPSHKENMQHLLDGLTSQIIRDTALDRKLEINAVRQLMDTSPYSPEEAVNKKMIDEIGYVDEVKGAIGRLLSKKPEYYPFEDYVETLQPSSKGTKVAVIYGEGEIVSGKAASNPLSDSMVMDADEIAKNIREAAEDETIKAIVFRIDSGGGSPIGSALIGREMEKARLKKPLIVSMAGYAASGGYWIACDAHKIVAQPGTITGSIGVLAGKAVTQGFWDSYGIHWGEVHSGENAGLWSNGQAFTEKGWRIFNRFLDKTYDMFLDKVAKGRGMPKEKVHEVAKGQVWTGEQARENGLVDELGGLDTAIAIARKEMRLAPDASLTLVHLPEQKSFISLLFERGSSAEAGILARYPALAKVLKQFEILFSPPEFSLKCSTPAFSSE